MVMAFGHSNDVDKFREALEKQFPTMQVFRQLRWLDYGDWGCPQGCGPSVVLWFGSGSALELPNQQRVLEAFDSMCELMKAKVARAPLQSKLFGHKELKKHGVPKSCAPSQPPPEQNQSAADAPGQEQKRKAFDAEQAVKIVKKAKIVPMEWSLPSQPV